MTMGFSRLLLLAEAISTAESETNLQTTTVVTAASQFPLLITIFALAVFVGVEIIAKIPPTLHTPLMSGSNAISGITVIGALVSLEAGAGTLAHVLGFVAVVLATVNVVGGFVVTHRMLGMFRRKG